MHSARQKVCKSQTGFAMKQRIWSLHADKNQGDIMNNRLIKLITDTYIGKEQINDHAAQELGKKLSIDILWFLAFTPHIIFLFFFLFTGLTPLFITNVVSVALYIFCRFLLNRGSVTLASRLILTEVFFYILISVYYLGTESQMQWYLALILIPIFYNLEYSTRHRTILCAIDIIVIALCMLYGKLFTAPYAGSQSAVFFYYFNSVFIISAIILEILTGNVVRGIVTILSSNDIELLRQQSYRDPLTNLYNRRYADIIFNEIEPNFASRRTPEKYAVAMIDIDDFKDINDRYGHDIGDFVLQKTVNTLQSNIRKDDYLFRWGGEEFLAIIRGVDLSSAAGIAQNLCYRVAQSVYICNQDLKISVTITIGIAPIGKNGFKEAITLADQNMYKGKNCGKNCVKS